MSGLMARIRRRRADVSPQAPLSQDAPGTVAPPAPTPDGDGQATAPHPAIGDPEPAPVEASTTVVPTPDVLPAGTEPAPTSTAGFRERGRMRRRLRYLRRLRELGSRDVGGLVFDLDRFGRSREDLVRAKLDALTAVDTELRTLEVALDDVRPMHELHEPGIASCPRCGGLHGSQARYCPSCGLNLAGPREVGEVAGPALPAVQTAGDTGGPTEETTAVESASGATSGAPAADGDGPTLATAPNGSGPEHSPATESTAESEPAGDPAR
jgi:hypothetical protein